MAAVLDNNSIQIPTGAKVSILYKKNSSQGRNQWETVEIVDDESNKFLALFECDNVDFKIRIDNRESNIQGGLGFTVKTSSMERDFYVDFNRLWELETLEYGGSKLHFVSQVSTDGRQLVDIVAKELETTHIDASAKISRMELQFEAEKVPSPKEVIKIFVKTEKDKTLDLDVKISGTIADVKEQIFNMEGISADKQRLIFAGRELEDRRTIADYNMISEHATLLLQSQPQQVMSYGSQSGAGYDSEDGVAVGRSGTYGCSGGYQLVGRSGSRSSRDYTNEHQSVEATNGCGRGRAGRGRARIAHPASDASRPGVSVPSIPPPRAPCQTWTDDVQNVALGRGASARSRVLHNEDRPIGRGGLRGIRDIYSGVSEEPPVESNAREPPEDDAEEISPDGVTSTGNAERGVICFSEKSDQAFDTYSYFIADKSIEIKPIIIEFQIKTNLKLRC